MAAALLIAAMSSACDAGVAESRASAPAPTGMRGAEVDSAENEAGSKAAAPVTAGMGKDDVDDTGDEDEMSASTPATAGLGVEEVLDTENEGDTRTSVPQIIAIAPSAKTFSALEQTLPLVAEVRDQNGRVLTWENVSWSSSDPAVATVDSDGRVTAVGNGSTTVTATGGAVSGHASISVMQTASSVIAVPATVELSSWGATTQLAAEAFDENGHPVAGTEIGWDSSDPTVATVDTGGLVTAAGAGTATIAATAGEAFATTVVTVKGYTLSGTVSDARGTGFSAPCAAVRLRGDAERSTVVDSDGRYQLSGILGQVEIRVSALPGFVGQTVPVTVDSGDRTIDFLLEHTGDPPYGGTVWVTPDILGPSDPSALGNVTYTGRGMRDIFDRRVAAWITVDAYLFEVQFGDRLVEFQINPEFGSEEAAREQIDTFAPAIGRLPTVLISELREVEMNAGVGLFGGNSWNRSLLIHTDDPATQRSVREGWLEEIFLHEGSHMAIDPLGATAGWRAAQRADAAFISVYARDFPEREDIAETFLTYYAVRQWPERLTAPQRCIMSTATPNRFAFFDDQQFDLSSAPSP